MHCILNWTFSYSIRKHICKVMAEFIKLDTFQEDNVTDNIDFDEIDFGESLAAISDPQYSPQGRSYYRYDMTMSPNNKVSIQLLMITLGTGRNKVLSFLRL